MNSFSEKIRQKKADDLQGLNEAFKQIADAVMRKQGIDQAELSNMMAEEVIKIVTFYDFRSINIPEGITEFEDVLDSLCRKHGIMRRGCSLKRGWHKNASGAFLGVLKENGRPVALIPKKLGYYYYDADRKKNIRVTSERENLFEECAICFYKPFLQKPISIKDLLAYAFSTVSGYDIAGMVIMTALMTAVSYFIPRVNYFLYSEVAGGGYGYGAGLLISTMVFFLCLLLGNIIFKVQKDILRNKIITKMDASVQAAAMMRLFSLPPSFFRKYPSGELSVRLSHINKICSSMIDIVFSSLITALFSLVYFSELFQYDAGLVVCALVSVLLMVALTVFGALFQIKHSLKQNELESKENGMVFSAINGIQKIRLSGSEKKVFKKWAGLYSKEVNLTYNAPFLVKYSGPLKLLISLASTVVIYYLSGSVVRASTGDNLMVMLPAELIAFLSAYGLIMAAFMNVADLAAAIAGIKPSMEMARPILEAVPETSENRPVVTSLSGAVEMNGISFRYDEQSSFILKDLNLRIDPGEYVAVVGKSGCGKSTLVRLLLGFEKPEYGAVYYDGRDVESLDVSSLRRKIGVVMQNGELFTGTIFDNIRLNAPEITQEEAWEAAEKADIADMIRELPMGMSTLVIDGGTSFSGGQTQRLLIARAIAANPSILIFDEATSALDNNSQKKVSQALDSLKCTRIVIAHRLSTIMNCNRILFIDKGKVAEEGTYDELLEKNGLFAELVERQMTKK